MFWIWKKVGNEKKFTHFFFIFFQIQKIYFYTFEMQSETSLNQGVSNWNQSRRGLGGKSLLTSGFFYHVQRLTLVLESKGTKTPWDRATCCIGLPRWYFHKVQRKILKILKIHAQLVLETTPNWSFWKRKVLLQPRDWLFSILSKFEFWCVFLRLWLWI